MARRIHSRYIITGTLIAQSPIHVGGLGGNADTDLALAVDGQGRYYIPGTSLAGALRGWMELIDPDTTDHHLWGFQEDDRGHASFILVEDAPIQLSEGMLPELRNGVAIDRNWGTAANRMKYDRAILPKGVKIPLKLTLERAVNLSDPDWQKYQTQFAQLLTALTEGQISLGAAKTRGLGRIKLNNFQIHEQILSSRQGMLDTLLKGGSLVSNKQFLVTLDDLPLIPLELEIHWKPVSPVMVKAEGDGIAVDNLPLVSGNHGGLTFVIPGSSIKGSLRSQAERIIRTVLRHETPKNDFSKQIQVPLVKTLFGEAADDTKQSGYLGTIAIDDCFANIPLTYHSWAQVENATDEQTLRKALDDSNLKDTQQAFHVAIDRWTGGAADSFLYTVLEPMGFSWQPINLSLNLARLKKRQENEYLPSIALLLLLLRDLMDSKIPLGFGTNQGMGAIQVEKIKITGKNLEEIQDLENITLTKQDLSDLDTGFLQNLSEQWQTWINLKNKQND